MLKVMAYGAGTASIPPLVSPPDVRVQLRREGTDPSVVREIRRMLQEAFQGRNMGFYFSHLGEDLQEEFTIQINPDQIFPVASSFKAAVVLYYFLNTPESEWNAGEGTDVYRMAVFSNNGTTGSVIYDVGQRLGADNPIVAFNDFVMDYLGLEWGLFQWTFAEFFTPTNGYQDLRFDPTNIQIDIPLYHLAVNFSTTAEMASVFRFMAQAENDPRWESDPHFRAAIEASREVLSIPAAPTYISPLEEVIAYTDHYSKDGTLRPVDIGTVVQNDAGVWLMTDGGKYLISFMSVAEGDETISTNLALVAESLRMYENYLHPNDFHFNQEPSVPLHMGEYDYGFVRRTGIPLYTQPDLNAEQIDNYLRPTSIFGTTYIMYGALMRIRAVNNEWGEVVPDDRWDKALPRPTYLRLEDLQIIDRIAVTRPIGYVTGQPENVGKFAVLDIYKRELILFEGITPILRTPVIVNTENTPRGMALMQRAYLTRDMPNYPGVPYTYFLHGSSYLNESGFAIHGAPWHLWSDTVRQRAVVRRLTHGCINVPDWEIPIPYYDQTMRPDQFVFRWAGGFPNPESETTWMNNSATPVRVYLVNNPHRELWEYWRHDGLTILRADWGDVLDALDAKSVDAAEVFFS
jgi:hypothetical protein